MIEEDKESIKDGARREKVHALKISSQLKATDT